jgi:hypothetical protein
MEQTMLDFPALPKRISSDLDEEAPQRSTTDKFNLKLIPLTMLLDHRLTKDGREPKSISMCATNLLRLLQESAIVQGCYHGHIKIFINPELTESDIVIDY